MAAGTKIERYIDDLGSADLQIKLKALKRLDGLGSAASEAVPQVIPLLNDPAPKVRAWAARTLGYIGPQATAAVPSLIRALDDKITNVRSSAACALGRIGQNASPAIPALQKALQDPKYSVQITASIALGSMGPSAVSALNDMMKIVSRAKTFNEKYAAWESIKKILGRDFNRDTLLRYVESENIPKANPFEGNFEDQLPGKKLPQKETVEKYLLGLKDIEPGKRVKAMKKLSDVVSGKQEDLNRVVIPAIPDILSLLSDPSWKVRSWAVRLLGRIGPAAEAAIPHLITILEKDQTITVRECAAFALGLLGPKAESAIPILEKVLHDRDREVRTHAHMALRRLQHKSDLSGKLYDDDEFVSYKIDDDILDIHYYVAGYRRRTSVDKTHLEVELTHPASGSESRLPEKETIEKYLLNLKDARLVKRLDAMFKLDKVIRAGYVDLNFVITNITPEIISVLQNDESWKVRGWAVWLLGQTNSPIALSPLITALEDQKAAVREFAARMLSRLDVRAAASISMLEKALHDPGQGVRTAAHMALRKIQQKSDLSERMYADDELVGCKIDDDTLDIHYYEVGYRRRAASVNKTHSQSEGISLPNGAASQPLRLRVGDQICFTKDVWRVDAPDAVASFLGATQGSIGTVISYDEYCESIRKEYPGEEWIEYWFRQVKEQLEKEDYLIGFEWIEPLSDWELAVYEGSSVFVDCKVGGMDIFPVTCLEKITLLPSPDVHL